jgi:Ser/Thr protein kinase RdoA (MazF antagonist)
LDCLHRYLDNLGNAVVNGLISISDFSLIQDVVRFLERIVSGLEKTFQTWGLIHGDLNEENYLFYGDEVRPIDFSGCVYGYFLYDICSALPHLHPDARRSFLRGYERRHRLPKNYMEFLEAFFMWWWVSNISFHCMDPEEQEYLASLIPEFLASCGKSFLAGESLELLGRVET